ncbi:serine/threonine protein kinase [Actinocrinis puniceicyclus]|uniref:non-specific serine/threonine protein kinase n=1 Tax=Actinocrinis puniceicyclus TaxID=977794 RepID=A0A8J8BC42_9ACTN|nr:serine/threonine-protein kinase [Actinocrinis puniceicyclus]MBS2964732.1 serine/threonine protein kinase [Actinocrinis puniceicyclus]
MSAANLPKPPAIQGYEYRGPIGSGGSSYVYLYYEQTPFRRVAVKMPRTFGPDPDRRTLFVDEANVMAQLGHEKLIVPVLAFKEAVDGTPCLVTFYYEEGDLHRRVKRLRQLPVAEVLTIGRQLAEAVAAAHTIGLLHQDIKPANVFIAQAGSSYLLGDFGIARRLKHEQGTFALSPSWAAPEVMREENAIASKRSDIYSLGATLWHLLSGSAPFVIPHGDNSPASLRQRTLAGQPTPGMARRDVPPQLTDLLLRMLARDPRNRPQSADDVLAALTRIAAEGGAAGSAAYERRADEIDETVLRDAPPRSTVSPGHSTQEPVSGFGDFARSAPQRDDDQDDQTVLHAKGAPVPSNAPESSAYGYQRPRDDGPRDVLAQNQTMGSHTVLKDRSRTETLTDDQPTSADGQSAARNHRRGLVVSLGALTAVAVVVVVVATLSMGGSAQGNAPGTQGVSASATGDVPVDPGVALGGNEPPGAVTVTATRTGSATVHFSWTYSAALASDTFRWQSSDGKRTGTAKTPALDLPDPAGIRLCVQIKVVRLDGSNGDPDWSQPGCGQ